jgi:hypothetical protein
MTEDQLQAQIYTYYNNNYCLKNQNPRGIIFSVPNGGTRFVVEAKKLKQTGLLSGVSDLILITPKGKAIFLELKTQTGKQSDSQKDFEIRIKNLGYKYYIIRTLEEFKELINSINKK